MVKSPGKAGSSTLASGVCGSAVAKGLVSMPTSQSIVKNSGGLFVAPSLTSDSASRGKRQAPKSGPSPAATVMTVNQGEKDSVAVESEGGEAAKRSIR